MSLPHITYFPELIQGSEEWFAARCGMLTASEMHLIVTPTLKQASNDKERTQLYELLAQRISRFVEPQYVSDAMLRGEVEEIEARNAYSKRYAPVREVGFVVNRRWGFSLGCSPDGLVDKDPEGEGLIECKSRGQKYQVQTIVEHVPAGTIPPEFMLQVQTALLVTERHWCDFISYSGGLPMAVIRVHPDDTVQTAIIEAASAFEARLSAKLVTYRATLKSDARLVPTERILQEDILA